MGSTRAAEIRETCQLNCKIHTCIQNKIPFLHWDFSSVHFDVSEEKRNKISLP